MSISNDKALLIVEDDPGLQTQLKWCLSAYDVVVVEDRASALAEVKRRKPPVITLDLGLPPDPANASEGLAALKEILAVMPETKIIVVTGNDDHEHAVSAVAMGAYDFYEKPVDPSTLSLIVERAFRLYHLEEENRLLKQQIVSTPLKGIIAASPQMLKVCKTIEKVAPTDATVLLLGESGTGKELLARALHDLSERREHRFVPINCAAIPETLLESELFGFEKGAFTGANKQTRGKFEYADGGTLFLDEVGDLPEALQAKLLRFLQERIVERIGGREEISVDVRVVCATHQDLSALITQRQFREDLYYRISEITVDIPPLRDRAGDGVVLARAFLQKFAKEHGRKNAELSKDAISAIEAYDWPGNAREMENRIKRAVIMAEGHRLTALDLGLGGLGQSQELLNLRDVRQQAERDAIQRALSRHRGKISKAAESLGVSRPTLYDLLSKYGLSVD
jgi:two-component system NtrC family response regulator